MPKSCDLNREALGLRRLPSTTKVFWLRLRPRSRAASSHIDDFVASRPPSYARDEKKAAA